MKLGSNYDLMLLRLREVMRLTGLARSTIYKLMREGAFPKPIKLSARAVAWRSDELSAWIDQRCLASARTSLEAL